MYILYTVLHNMLKEIDQNWLRKGNKIISAAPIFSFELFKFRPLPEFTFYLLFLRPFDDSRSSSGNHKIIFKMLT